MGVWQSSMFLPRWIAAACRQPTTAVQSSAMAIAPTPTMTVISTPNNTLYVSNIDWKIKKPLLRRALYALFTRHGKVRFRSFSLRVQVCL
jgi:hypothetical protein